VFFIFARRSRFAFAFLVMVFSAIVSYAETDIEIISQQNDQILQQQDQANLHDQKQLEKEREWTLLQGGSVAEKDNTAMANDRCFDVKKIDVTGVHSVKPKRIHSITLEHEGKCLGLAEINEILSTISSLYLDKGYVTTRAYLPQQNLSLGILNIEVIEGHIETLSAQPDAKIQIFNAFPRMKNKPLNLRDIEQGIEQLNRLGANQVWMELAPGSKAGASEVQLFNKPQRSWQASVRIDNSGSPSTGEYQARVSVSGDHLLRLNDFLSLSYQSDLEENKTGKLSESFSMHFDVPFGYWLLGFDGNLYSYKNRVEGQNQTFDTSGNSNKQTITISRVLYRGQTGKTEWINSLSRKENENYIEDVKLDTSSRNLATGKLQLRHRELLPKQQVLQGSVSYQRGLDLFGSPKKSAIDNSPEPLYQALLGDVSYQKSFKLFNRNRSLSSSITWQYSDDVLFGSEQFGVGSLYSVRGFNGEGASGRSGAYWRNDISWSYGVPKNWFGVHSISPTFGWDIGGIFNEPTSSENNEILQGVAAGLRIGGQHLSADITYAHAMSRPDQFKDDRNQIHFALTFKR